MKKSTWTTKYLFKKKYDVVRQYSECICIFLYKNIFSVAPDNKRVNASSFIKLLVYSKPRARAMGLQVVQS